MGVAISFVADTLKRVEIDEASVRLYFPDITVSFLCCDDVAAKMLAVWTDAQKAKHRPPAPTEMSLRPRIGGVPDNPNCSYTSSPWERNV